MVKLKWDLKQGEFFKAEKIHCTKNKSEGIQRQKMKRKFGISQENPSIDNKITKMKPEMQILNSVCLHIHFFH